MNEIYSILKISPDATEDEIKRAYRQAALKYHPDKEGGSIENMKKLNQAYAILTNAEERKKWEAEHANEDDYVDPRSEPLDFFGERPSASARRCREAFIRLFKVFPLADEVSKNRKAASDYFTRNSLRKLLKSKYYTTIYFDNEVWLSEDVYDFVRRKSEKELNPVLLDRKFFSERLTVQKGLEILRAFLRGEYYGRNLSAVRQYLAQQMAHYYSKDDPEILLCSAVQLIISAENLEKNYSNILTAIENIHTAIYQGRYVENPEVIDLFQDKHVRYLLASALKHYWEDEKFVYVKQIIQQMQSKFTHLRKLFPMSKLILKIEKQIQDMLLGSPLPEEIYENAYLLIDLFNTCISAASRTNSAFMVALCFQYASQIEEDKAQAMAAESMALTYYQLAGACAFHANPILGLYALPTIVKCVSNLNFNFSTVSLDELKKFIMQPGDRELAIHSGSVISTIEGSIKRALYLVDIVPFYSTPKSSVDLEIMEILELGMFRQSLNVILTKINKDNPLLETKANLPASILLSANLPDDLQTPIAFEEQNVAPDGNCGFAALGTDRITVCSKLYLCKDNIEDRKFLSEEIMEAFVTYISTEGEEGLLAPDTAVWRNLQNKYETEQKEFDQLFCEIQNNLLDKMVITQDNIEASIQWLENNGKSPQAKLLREKHLDVFRAKSQLEIFCEKVEVFEYYVEALSKDLWLGYKSALLYAKQVNTGLYIWRKSTHYQLELIKHSTGNANISPQVHILHTDGFTHFNLLVPSPLLKEESQPLSMEKETQKEEDPQQKQEDFERAKIFYHAYEMAIKGWCEEEMEQEQEKEKLTLKMQTIEALLKESDSDTFEMSRWIDVPYIHMQRDAEGWLLPVNELDFSEKAGIALYQSFDGYEIDTKTGMIKFMMSEWKPEHSPSQKLFTDYDVAQMIRQGIIGGGFFTLDHADPHKQFDPLQKMRFYPSNIAETEFLKTIFWTDYYLKMWTTAVEISARPPYKTRSTEKLNERLPYHLKNILNLCRKNAENKSQAHRFWLETGKIGKEEMINGTHTIAYFNDIEIKVKTHLLEFNQEGDLVDAKIDPDDDSPEAQFAREFTKHYDEIGTYFPEFCRVKELIKISGALTELEVIRLNNKANLEHLTTVLNNTSFWGEQKNEEIEKKSNLLRQNYQSLSPAFRQLRPTSDTAWWNARYNIVYQEKMALLQKVTSDFPKFFYNLYDSEVVQAYSKQHNDTYNLNYNSNYQSVKDKVIREHGIAVWNSEEASFRTQLATKMSQLVSQSITQQGVLNEMNAQAAQHRAQIRQSYYNAFSSAKNMMGEAAYSQHIDNLMNKNYSGFAVALANEEINAEKAAYNRVRNDFLNSLSDLKSAMGEAKCLEYVDQLLQGNVLPLAEALAQQNIQQAKQELSNNIAERQVLENSFLSLQFAEGKDDKNTWVQRVPAVFHQRTHTNASYHVYGGFGWQIQTEINKHSQDLNTPFKTLKESAIRDTKEFIQKMSMVSASFLLMGSVYGSTYFGLKGLESDVRRAESELEFIKRKEESEKRNRYFDHIHKINLDRIMVDINPAKNSYSLFHYDPFMTFRLNDDYARRAKVANTLRSTIKPETKVAIGYVESIYQGIREGIGDIKDFCIELLTNPWDGIVRPMLSLLVDAAVLGVAHYPLIISNTSAEGYAEYVSLKDLIEKNPVIYNEALSNMQQRLAHIKNSTEIYFNAQNEDQFRMATRVTINLVSPASLVKLLNFTAAKRIKFMEKPIIFENTGEPVGVHGRHVVPETSFKLLTAEEIRNIKPKKVSNWDELMTLAKKQKDPHDAVILNPNVVNFIYVILLREGGKKEMRIVRQQQIKVKFLDGKNGRDEISHIDVAAGGKLIGAGNLFFEDGKLIRANEFSGHYIPSGGHLKSLTESELINFGIPEAKNKFVYDFHKLLNMPPSEALPGYVEYINPIAASVFIGTEQVIRETDPETVNLRRNSPF